MILKSVGLLAKNIHRVIRYGNYTKNNFSIKVLKYLNELYTELKKFSLEHTIVLELK